MTTNRKGHPRGRTNMRKAHSLEGPMEKGDSSERTDRENIPSPKLTSLASRIVGCQSPFTIGWVPWFKTQLV